MTRSEFNQWLEQHCGGFPQFSEWLHALPRQQRSEMLERWHQVFVRRKVTPEAALDASFEMLSRNSHPKQFDYQSLPGVIAGLCAESPTYEQGPAVDDDQRRYKCLRCRDRGIVEIFSWETAVKNTKSEEWRAEVEEYIEAATRLHEETKGMSMADAFMHAKTRGLKCPKHDTCAVACDCEEGQRRREAWKGAWLSFDESKHCEANGASARGFRKLLDMTSVCDF